MSAAKFPPVTRQQWEAKAEKDLKGRPLASLTRTTADGVSIPPVVMASDLDGREAPGFPGQYPGTRGRTAGGPAAGRGWLAIQELRHADPVAANVAARADRALGASGLHLVLDDALQAGREPSDAPTGAVFDPSRDFPTLLDGLDLPDAALFISAGLMAREVLDGLEDYLAEHELDEDEPPQLSGGVLADPLRGGVIYDPLTPLLRTGSLERSFQAALGEGVDAVLGSPLGLVGVSTAAYHEGGAGDAEELGLALAAVAELLRRGAPLGLEPADILPTLVLTLPLTGRPFEAVAKLRAARTLWAKLVAACGLSLEACPLWIHAESSRREWTRVGPWVNLLRGTVGTFAAAVGGADSIATASFDGLCGPEGDAVGGLGRGSELGRRLAIDTQIILNRESHLDRVIDPAGGSWAVERLTDDLARAAWTRFRAVEADGGLVRGLCSGAIQARVAEQGAALMDAVARRRRPITGVSTFPVLRGQAPPAQAPDVRAGEGPERHRTAPVLEPAEVAAIPALRQAAPFEALRQASDAHRERTGSLPRIAALNWGGLSCHQARTDFAANLFAAGGVELESGPGQRTVAAAIQAFTDTQLPVAVVCGRDPDYAEHGRALVAGLRAAGARRVWFAGRPPKDDPAAWGEGADVAFIYQGCDALTTLRDALNLLGVPAAATLTTQEDN